MTTTALYDALLEAGVSRETATRAVEGVVHLDQVTTKADLKDLEVRLTWRALGIVGSALTLNLAAIAALGAWLS